MQILRLKNFYWYGVRASGKSTMQTQRLLTKALHDKYKLSEEEVWKIVSETWYIDKPVLID